ncbi:MAG: protein kinase [Rhodothermales bacterium]
MIGSVVSHYHIVDELGRGGMGVVYLAEDTRLRRTVALKFLADHGVAAEQARERFMTEARAAAALNHTNIATLFDVVEDGDALFIAMEYVHGNDLGELIHRQELTPDQAIDYAIQIARGLDRAHEAGIIHRDIKPANIAVTVRGEIKILDFGLAKLTGAISTSQPGTMVGTPVYSSPEQIAGGEIDGRSDLWSLGVVLYEMLTFEKPFSGAYREAAYYAILNVDPPSISSIRPELGTAFDGVVGRLLNRDLAQRYPRAGVLIEDLEQLRAPASSPSAPVSSSASPIPFPPGRTPSSVREERRQLTVVYGEIAGFGDLLHAMDPEDVLELTDVYRSLWQSQVDQFDALPGSTTQGAYYAYFGYPTATENDASRAIRFGLAFNNLVAGLRKQGPDNATPPVRIGIHTGTAIVGEDGGTYQVHGSIGHVAARITQVGSSGCVVVGATTSRLVQGDFELEPLGAGAVQGFSEPVEIFKVVRETGGHSRLDFVDAADLSPLVGRDTEMAMLRQRWKQAQSGQGSVVLIAGEAGLGKSRLVDTFVRDVATDRRAWHTILYCSSFESSSALHPLTAHLKYHVRPPGYGEDEEDMEATRFDRLRRYLSGTGLSDDADTALLADLLNIPIPDGRQPPALAAAERQRRTMIALFHLLTARCRDTAGMIVMEDLHWADPSTLEWMEMLAAQTPARPLLVICTSRSQFRPGWHGKPRTVEITLNRLDPEDLVTISEHKSRKKLPREILDQIIEKTDGIPLFTEELTQMILESDILMDRGEYFELTGPIPHHAIPSTLQGSLVARLDRLPAEKSIAQIGAVLGREFSFEMLRTVSGEDEDVLARAIERLVEAELIYQRGFIPDASFIFKHALIQDAAYQTLVRKRKKALHGKVARALEDVPTESHPELIAYHYTQADQAARAIPYWLQAGQRAMARYENMEAVQHLSEGHRLVASLPPGSERDLTELSLLVPLGHALNMTKGWWAPEGEAIFSRAAELCQVIDEVEPRVLTLLGLGSTSMIRGDYGNARDAALKLLEAVRGTEMEDLSVVGDALLSAYYLFRGEFEASIAHADDVVRTYDPVRHDPLRKFGSGSLHNSCRLYKLLATQLMGYPEQACVQAAEMLDVVKAGDYHFDLYMAYLYRGLTLLTGRSWEACRDTMEEYLNVGREYGDPFPILITTIVHHLALRDEADEITFRSAKPMLDQLQGAGYGLGCSLLLGEYAAGLLHYGQVDGARSALDEAFRHIKRVGAEIWEAELHRLKGDILLETDHPADEIEASYQHALQIARRQGARLLELRSATSLARFRTGQQRSEEAHDVLAGIYHEFTEGFDEVDLREARNQLDAFLMS